MHPATAREVAPLSGATQAFVQQHQGWSSGKDSRQVPVFKVDLAQREAVGIGNGFTRHEETDTENETRRLPQSLWIR